MNLFKDAATYYKFRPEYPRGIIDLIVLKSGASNSKNLLDIGAGTGSLCIPLSKYFGKVFALDIDKSMIDVGRRDALSKNCNNIFWTCGDAMQLIDNTFDNIQAISFGCSLHWFDAQLILKKCSDIQSDDGLVIITGVYTIWKKTPTLWQQRLLEVIKKYLGPDRLTLKGQYSYAGKPKSTKVEFVDFLELSGYKRTEVVEFVFDDRILGIDEIIGYQYSTSYAAPSLFKDRLADFESELRTELLKIHPDNKFIEPNSGFVTFGWKK